MREKSKDSLVKDIKDYTIEQQLFIAQCDAYLNDLVDEELNKDKQNNGRPGRNIPSKYNKDHETKEMGMPGEMEFDEFQMYMGMLGLPVYKSEVPQIESIEQHTVLDNKQLQNMFKSSPIYKQ